MAAPVSSPGDIYDATGALVIKGARLASGPPGTVLTSDANGNLSLQPPSGAGVASVTAGDTSIVVGGSASAPTIKTGTLDVIASAHPPAAAVAMNGQKHTGLANGSASGDSVAYGQLGTAAFQSAGAFDASGAAAAAQAASDPLGSAATAAAYFLRVFAV